MKAQKLNNRATNEEILVEEEGSDTSSLPEQLEPEAVIRLIGDLPDGYRTVLNLYVFENYSHKEIATELGISENTSKSQLSKARALLRKKVIAFCNQKQLVKNERE
jgi:RNA polymerase sigma-70 factor (ECF subfamily)